VRATKSSNLFNKKFSFYLGLRIVTVVKNPNNGSLGLSYIVLYSIFMYLFCKSVKYLQYVEYHYYCYVRTYLMLHSC
jgi:hypothetical protein